MAEAVLSDPRGVGGVTATPYRRVEWMKATDTIADGDLVVIANDATNTDGVEVEHSVTDDDRLVVGIADAAITDGQYGPVVTYGLKRLANVATGVTAGTSIGTSTTAGRGAAAIAGSAIGVVVGATAASNQATVFVIRH